MYYADADYLLALLFSQKDRWAANARLIKGRIEEESEEVVTSEAALLETMWHIYNEGLDPIQYAQSAVCFVSPTDIKRDVFLSAAGYMKLYGLTPSDAFHVAHCWDEKHCLITSDGKILKAMASLDLPCIDLKSCKATK